MTIPSAVAASQLPVAIAIDQSGIIGLADFVNVIIVFAVAPVAAESVFIAFQILQSMNKPQKA
jgi:amino acid transporter